MLAGPAEGCGRRTTLVTLWTGAWVTESGWLQRAPAARGHRPDRRTTKTGNVASRSDVLVAAVQGPSWRTQARSSRPRRSFPSYVPACHRGRKATGEPTGGRPEKIVKPHATCAATRRCGCMAQELVFAPCSTYRQLQAPVVENLMEYVIGTKVKRAAADRLLEEFRSLGLPEGTLYVGYPVLSLEQSSESVDALLTSERHGVVLFDLLPDEVGPSARPEFWRDREERQTRLFLALKSKLTKEPALTKKRDLAIPIHIVTYAAFQPQIPNDVELTPAQHGHLREVLEQLSGYDPQYTTPLNATIQRVTTMKPVKRRPNVSTPTSKGAIMKELEKSIANLDRWQKRGAIECPEGPQRIRGLAGSGKTIILALKAAYLHAQHPDWTIAVTFHTRSLYQQFTDFIRRFYFEQSSDEPDWNKLHILHSWGTPREPGMYARIAALYGVPARDFNSAKQQFGYEHAFGGVCSELEAIVATSGEKGHYDAVLIDEAQDLPKPFFRLVYAVTKKPKRVAWAYDELQNLGAYSMETPAEIFGTDGAGNPLVRLDNPPGEAHQDVVLKMCYRNTPWALTVAHALGFGIHRTGGLVQFFDDTELWNAIGYDVVEGDLSLQGTKVRLRRGHDASPPFFLERLQPDDAVKCVVFRDAAEQAQWVANNIVANVRQDELDLDDVLVIYPDPLTVAEKAAPLRAALAEHGIDSHIAGVTTSRDEFFRDQSVTISGIYRAKGNEAPMVYILDANFCNGVGDLAKKRSMLFTGITRSRAWVRICGQGPAMVRIKQEVDQVIADGYSLYFNTPTSAERDQLRRLHRDMTLEEKKRLAANRDSAERLAEALESGDFDPSQLAPDIRDKLLRGLTEPVVRKGTRS
jgi:superfamily I DNA and RNA helicase